MWLIPLRNVERSSPPRMMHFHHAARYIFSLSWRVAEAAMKKIGCADKSRSSRASRRWCRFRIDDNGTAWFRGWDWRLPGTTASKRAACGEKRQRMMRLHHAAVPKAP